MRRLAALCIMAGGVAAQWPAKPQSKPVVLEGGTVHTVSGATLEGASVVFANGKIVAAGTNVVVPAGARRLDCRGKHVYPGLIGANTVLGLVEVNAVRSTRDFAEVGSVSPEVRAEVAFHPDSALIPVTRHGGVTCVLSVPQGGLVSGSSALMELDGWTWEDMTRVAPVAIHVRWPSMRVHGPKAKELRKARDEALAKIRAIFEDARAYAKAKQGEHRIDRRLEALLPVIEKRIPVFVHADDRRQIEAALDWAEDAGVQLVIVGGADAPDCAAALKAAGVPVVVAPVLRVPRHRDDPYDAPFTVAKRLFDAGVAFCIATSGSPFDAAHERNLPYNAAMAAAYGLPKQEALRAVTLYPARIFGAGDKLGSIEAGKDATLIVTTGDPLDVRTHVVYEFIRGREIDLDSRHEQLYRKYREKYRRLGLLGNRKR